MNSNYYSTPLPTKTKVHWGRIVILFAALGLIGFAFSSTLGAAPNSSQARTVEGGGTSTPDLLAEESQVASPAPVPEAVLAEAQVEKPVVNKPRVAQKKQIAKKKQTVLGGGVGTAAANQSAANAATPGELVDGELPMTGAEHWVAAILGVLVLALGIVLHVNAVRIGMTAMLYRRGILLRPVECAQLAHKRGLPVARIWLSNALGRLLEEPAQSDFVSVR